jgi:hypothetical protein
MGDHLLDVLKLEIGWLFTPVGNFAEGAFQVAAGGAFNLDRSR